jgi:hypothetical protein
MKPGLEIEIKNRMIFINTIDQIGNSFILIIFIPITLFFNVSSSFFLKDDLDSYFPKQMQVASFVGLQAAYVKDGAQVWRASYA